jgi:hypothetical protein
MEGGPGKKEVKRTKEVCRYRTEKERWDVKEGRKDGRNEGRRRKIGRRRKDGNETRKDGSERSGGRIERRKRKDSKEMKKSDGYTRHFYFFFTKDGPSRR